LNSQVHELLDGVHRVTFPLPLGIDHVHCYLLGGADGWTVVDTGLGVPDARERWARLLEELDGPVARVVITHFHPDHVGAAADVAELTGAPVHQGREDYGQCVRVWGEPGQRVDDWEVLSLRGHADGHLGLLRDGVLVAGDALLAGISPNVGLYPESRPDPLGDYLESLRRVIELAPRVAYAGHRESIEDPAARAQALIAHHGERLDQALRAVDGEPRNAYEVSLLLFPDPLHPTLRRFALAEARAHLERLVLTGRAGRVEAADSLRYSA
jgi:glyoxylase-like metal-dependent hydrolase (beta-lactamase superfamily II)